MEKRTERSGAGSECSGQLGADGSGFCCYICGAPATAGLSHNGPNGGGGVFLCAYHSGNHDLRKSLPTVQELARAFTKIGRAHCLELPKPNELAKEGGAK